MMEETSPPGQYRPLKSGRELSDQLSTRANRAAWSSPQPEHL